MPVMEETRKVQTTLRLPKPLYDQARNCAEKTTVQSINEFFVAAISAYLKILRRRRIDAAFCEMAEDAEYQKEALLIAEEFSASDWEALELTERDSVEE